MPAEVQARGNLESELTYGNHRSAAKYGEEVLNNAATDVALGRTIVLQQHKRRKLRGTDIFEGKMRVIYDLTFEAE